MDPQEQVSLAPVEQQPEQVSIAEPQYQAPVDPSIAAEKVAKAKYGMPNLNLPNENMFKEIIAGREDSLRKSAAASVDIQVAQRKQQILIDWANKQNRPVSPIEADTFRQFLNTKETNPDTVFEEFYAKSYLENLEKARVDNPDSFLNDIAINFPEALPKAKEVGTDLKAKRELIPYFRSLIDKDKSERGTVRTAFDFAKSFFPGYNAFNFLGVSEHTGRPVGEGLNQTAADTFMLPIDKYKAKNEAIIKSLLTGKLGGNADLAEAYLAALEDPNQVSTVLNNAGPFLDVMFTAAKPAELVLRRANNVALKSAIADIAKSADTPSATQSVINGSYLEAFKRKFEPERTVNMQGSDRIRLNTEQKAGFIGPSPIEGKLGLYQPSTMSVVSHMEQVVKNIENLTKDGRFVMPQTFRAEEAFSERSLSVTSHMDNMITRAEAAGAEAAGNVKAAGVANAAVEVNKSITAGTTTSDSLKALPSSFDTSVNRLSQDTRGFSQEFVNRVADQIRKTGDDLVSTIQGIAKVERVPGLMASIKTIQALADKFKTDYPGIANSVLNHRIEPVIGGRGHIEIMELGRTGTDLFGSAQAGKNFVLRHLGATKGALGAEVKQKGAGWYISIQRPIDETSPIVRASLLELESSRTPTSMLDSISSYLSAARTPQETLAREQNMNRLISDYGPNKLFKIAKEAAKDIEKMKGLNIIGTSKRKLWNEWEQATKSGLQTNGGKFFDTIGEMSDHWQNTLKRVPQEQEVAAYFAQKSRAAILDQLDVVNRRVDKLRQGAQTHTIFNPTLTSKEARVSNIKEGRTNPLSKVEVDGTILHEWPHDGETVFLTGGLRTYEGKASRAYDPELKPTQSVTGKRLQHVMEDVKQGKKFLIKLSNPEEFPLKPWTDKLTDKPVRPKYVLADQVTSKPLRWEEPRGLPMRTDYEHYVAQPNIFKDAISGLVHYDRDIHVAAFNNRVIGQDFAVKLQTIRRMLEAGQEDAAKAFHATSGLPEWSQVKDMFGPGKLSLSEDIKLVPRNLTFRDMDKSLETKYPNLKDNTKDMYKSPFSTPSDNVITAENLGTRENPLYNIVPTKYVDPSVMINRSLNRVINDTFLNDYKVSAIEHWIQEAKDYLTASDKDVASSPQYFFHNPTFKQGTPEAIKNNLMTSNMQIKQFLGVQDRTSTFLHDMSQQLADITYGTKFERLTPPWLISSLRDPFAFVRSMAFQPVMGLFSLPQLFLQGQTFVNIWGIAGPKFAAPGTKAALLHAWSAMSKNPEILEHLDSLAAKQLIPGSERWRPGWWREAHDALSDTGFFIVDKEYALRDNPFGHTLIGNAGTKALNLGEIFFRKGEQATRVGAGYTAFLEHRVKNPTGAIDNNAMRQILNRADLLNVNMSRASSSILHKGVLSLPTMFFTYTLRQAELMLGKRLTSTEKLRLFGTNAALYGVPTALGLSGVPFGDKYRQDAIQNGYNPDGNNFFNEMIMEGGVSAFLHKLTDNQYAVKERYGSQGLGADFWRSDTSFWKILGGAPASILSNQVASWDGYYNAVLSGLRDDGKVYTMTADDWVKPFLQIKSLNDTYQLATALSTGRQLTKTGAYIGDISAGNAIFQYISGLSPQVKNDEFLKTLVGKSEEDKQKLALTRASEEWRRFLTADRNGDREQALDYFKNTFAILRIMDYPEDKMPTAFAIMAHGNESLIQQVDSQFYMKNIPESVRDERQKAFLQLIEQGKR